MCVLIWLIDYCGWRCVCGKVVMGDEVGKKSGGYVMEGFKGFFEWDDFVKFKSVLKVFLSRGMILLDVFCLSFRSELFLNL